MLAGAAADRDTVTDFTAGTGGDVLQIDVAFTDAGTTDGAAPVLEDDTSTAAAGGGAYAMTTADTGTDDVVVLQSGAALSTGTNGGDLSAATDGTELLKALTNTAAADTYTGITLDNADDGFIAIAYQGGNAYVYRVLGNDGDTLAEADEIALIATLTGVAADSIVVGNLDLIP